MTGVSGVTVPSCMAAAIVMSLAVEPGSKTSPKALFVRLPLARPMSLGS